MSDELKSWIGRGASFEDAVARGLRKLSVPRDRVNVDVLEEKVSTLFSMMGFSWVKVKLTVKPLPARPPQQPRRPDREDRLRPRHDPRDRGKPAQPPQRADETRRNERREERDRHSRDRRDRPPQQQPPRRPEPPQKSPRAPAPPRPQSPAVPAAAESLPRPSFTPESLLAQWKTLTGWADLEWTLTKEGNDVSATLKTSRGERLAPALPSWEYLFNLILERAAEPSPRVRFRVEGAADTREREIADQALNAAAEVKRSGRLYRLDPMPSEQRRIVHQTLKDDPDVETFSEGEGPWRKVVVRPKTRSGADPRRPGAG
jgi:spoIIIJ-associated protein